MSQSVREVARICRFVGICVVELCLAVGAAPGASAANPLAGGQRQASQPAKAQMMLQVARATRSAGDLAAAIPLYREIAGAPKADPALEVELGDTLLQAGRIDDAIGAYESVPASAGAEVDALLGLRNAYARLGQSQAALEYAQRAIALSPQNQRAEVSLGVSLDAVNRHGEAQAAYRAALSLAPRSVAARNDLALSLALTGQFPEAIALLRPIASSTNASGQSRQNLAFIYGLEGDRADALAWSQADLPTAEAEANGRLFDLARAQPK